MRVIRARIMGRNTHYPDIGGEGKCGITRPGHDERQRAAVSLCGRLNQEAAQRHNRDSGHCQTCYFEGSRLALGFFPSRCQQKMVCVIYVHGASVCVEKSHASAAAQKCEAGPFAVQFCEAGQLFCREFLPNQCCMAWSIILTVTFFAAFV